MSLELFTVPTLTAISMFALAWFVIGVLAGRLLPKPSRTPRPSRQRPEKGSARGKGRTEIFVGNLSYDVSESELARMFGKYGKVASARLIENRASKKSKGYGFVEMADAREAADAIKAFNGKEIKGRKLVVNEAKSRPRRR